MRTTKREMKRKGFTLVELLIVIVVIGVLSAMMMLSSTEAVSSAKASDVVSDLRNLKTAALAYYADHLDTVEGRNGEWAGLDDPNVRKEVLKYMNNETKDEYTFGGETNGKWFVWCKVTDSKVFDKLKSRRTSVGLWNGADAHAVASGDLGTATFSTNGSFIGMFIR